MLLAVEIQKLALRLDYCGLPFLQVLNCEYLFKMLPEEEQLTRGGGGGVGVANQDPCVSGYQGTFSLTTDKIPLPQMNDHVFNVRILEEKKVGRDDET